MSFSSEQVCAVILAGGFGTRIRHLLPDLPKPMASAAGRPFIEWVVRFLANHGVHRILISTGFMSEKIEEHFQRERISNISVRCFPEKAPLGTAGGFLNAARLSEERPGAWLVLNGDSLLLGGLELLYRTMEDPNVLGAILGREMKDASRYGTLVANSEGRVLSFAEKQPGEGTINAGVYLFRSSVLPLFHERVPLNFEQEVFPLLIKKGIDFRLAKVQAPFLDIGTEATLKQAEGFILQNKDCFLNC
jgi:D-glycero-alpha-D-manno-heptose 1-phosphate guanylyltransferase